MMKMPSNVAAWFQFKLYLITVSGYSADSFTCAKPGELDNDLKFRWQLAVDMIYRGIQCGLMNVWDGRKRRPLGEQTLALVKELAQFDPNSDSFAVCWVGPEIEATDLCEALVKKFDIQNFEPGQICVPFIEQIEALFDRNSVSWSDAPFIELESGAAAQS